jgi:hypothetical protein
MARELRGPRYLTVKEALGRNRAPLRASFCVCRFDVTPAGKATWWCHCDCGVESIATGSNMTAGFTNSCGCLSRKTSAELAHVRFFRHGHSSRISCTPEYRSWAALRARCKYLKVNSYDRYGGRGITVCKPWEKFENFLADMGPKPSPKHSIDRFPDNDGNYEPDNCRWATGGEQRRNQRRT